MAEMTPQSGRPPHDASAQAAWRPDDPATLSRHFDVPRWRGRAVVIVRWAESSRPALLCAAADDPDDKVFATPDDLRGPGGPRFAHGPGRSGDPDDEPGPGEVAGIEERMGRERNRKAGGRDAGESGRAG